MKVTLIVTLFSDLNGLIPTRRVAVPVIQIRLSTEAQSSLVPRFVCLSSFSAEN